ncbi:MAG: CNNM domain-containing protein [bacterium]
MTLLLVYLAIAIGVSFLCSVLEAVLLSVSPSFVEDMAERRPAAGQRLKQVRTRLDESLSSILILNTFAHTMGAAGVGSQALQVFGEKWETLIAVLLTLAILYFSEIIPKTLGATYWRKLSVPSAFVISWLVKLVYPLVWISTRLTKLFNSGEKDGITREEIIALASLGQKEGTLVSREGDYLENLLRLREIRTEQVLTPRSVVYMLQKDQTLSEALDQPQTTQFSRMPVFGQTKDEILGKVLSRDLYQAERAGKGDETVEKFIIPIARVSEKLPVQHLMDMFIRQHDHMALVEDEFGQTAGVVTLEDAIETLLGREIIDETDAVVDMQALARQKYRQRLRADKEE